MVMLYLHGLVVNTENGTLCLNSSVMCSASGGLWVVMVTHVHQMLLRNQIIYSTKTICQSA